MSNKHNYNFQMDLCFYQTGILNMRYIVFLFFTMIIHLQCVSAKNICKPSEITINNYEPFSFEKTNNLLRHTGQNALYCGEKIIVSGRLLDQNCKPISDAKIYAWQANCQGKYPYKPLKNKVNHDLIDPDNPTTFTANGTAVTNNLGEFHFVTVYPKSVHELPSHINIRAKHYMLGEMQTRLILKGNKLENLPANYRSKTFKDTIKRDNISVYDFQIVM